MGELRTEVVAVLNERAADRVADVMVRTFGEAGRDAGLEMGKGLQDGIQQEMARINAEVSRLGNRMQDGFADHGRRSGRSFGGSFSSELTQAIPGVSGFSSAMSGYEGAAGKMGAVAGRALGMAFTTAAAGLIGAAGYTLFKGFERYEAIDAAKNRLDNLNRTLAQSGRATIDVGAAMKTVNDVVLGTPFALDQAFSIATRALSTSSGDLKRFMTDVANAAGFAGEPIDQIGEAFLKVANQGKVSMDEIGNELRELPIQQWLAETTGKSSAEITKMISDGKVGLEDLLKAVEGHVSGFAKGSADTIQGAVEQANTAVARLGANFLGALFGKPTDDANGLKDAIKSITERLDDVNKWVTAHQEDIKRYFQQAIDVARDLLNLAKEVTDAVGGLGNAATIAGTAFVAWKAAGVIATVAELAGGITTVGTGLAAIPGLAAAAAGPIAALAAAAAAAAAAGHALLNSGRDIALPVDSATPVILDGERQQVLNNSIPQGGPPVRGPHGGAGDRRRQELLNAIPGPAGNPILPAPGNDGSGSGPKLPKAPVVAYDATLPPSIPGMPQDASVFGAESSFLDARHTLAEKRARLAQLEADSNATEQDVLNARNDVVAQERDFQAAEMRMGEARASQYEKLTKQTRQHIKDLGDIGASLDSDFGISKGLAGIAENITKFVANLAAAPLLGQLSAISQANPSQGGYGLMGIMGARGAFGPNFTGIDYSKQQQGGYSPSAMGPATLGGGNVGAMLALAQGANGGKYDYGASDLAHGLADCSGAISDLYEVLTKGQSTPARAFTTESDFAALGFQRGYQPGAFNIGVHNGGGGMSSHMAATLPNGVNFESGGAHGNIAYGGPAAGALDRQFENKYYLPVGPTAPIGPTAPMGPTTADIYSPANTNPALNNPAAPSPAGTPTPTLQDLMNQFTGGGGQGPIFKKSPDAGGPVQPWSFPVLPQGGPPVRGPHGGYGDRARARQVDPGFGVAIPGFGGPTPTSAPGSVGPFPAPAPVAAAAPPPPQAPPGPTAPAGPAAPFTDQQYGGVTPASGTGKGGVGMTPGGTLDTAVGMAASGLDLLAPGAGQAAQTGIKLANRAIQYGGQVAGIGVQGLMETFLPTGGSELANNNWATRIIGGLAGAAPALPNVAGKGSQPKPEDVANIDPAAAANGQVQPANNTTQITVNNNRPTEDGTGRDIAYHQQQANLGPGM